MELQYSFYGGVNYFAVEGLSGSSPVKIVTCAGVTVNMTPVQRTSTGTTGFTCRSQTEDQALAKLIVTLTNDGKSTAYANGRLYYN